MGFAVVPAIIFSLEGEPTRIVVVDPSGRIAPRLRENLSAEKMTERARRAARESMDISQSQEEQIRRSSQQLVDNFVFVPYDPAGQTGEILRAELAGKVTAGQIDAFLIVPENYNAPEARFEFRSRRAGDIIVNDTFKDALNAAVRSQRLADADISEDRLAEIGRSVVFDAKGISETGEDKESSGVWIASFIIGLMIYITLAIYGQAIMGAVVEEKETRIAEILFSSARPYELMLGKLVGVGLAGLTQLGIWVGTAAVVIGIIALQPEFAGIAGAIPEITPLMVLYFLIFFLLGFFSYASIFALIGSMVTSVQEGGQFAFPPIMILLVGFYFSFAVLRDPGSTLSFWVSISPFFAPITMPVRILAEMPPFWHIALAIVINCFAIAGLVWVAARVYRVGMLMYGKRATLPEIWKWIRQA
jgi:ABC-2 type transport system permease protein